MLKSLATVLFAVTVVACGGDTTPVVIATAGPWAMANGAMHKRGVDLAIEHINAAGGVSGRQVRLRRL